MPNLVGIHDPTESRESLERDLAHMMRAVDLPRFPYVRATVTGPGIACGNVLTGVENNLSQPARDPSRGLWLMLDGEILNSGDLERELGLERARMERLDDAGIALAMYVAHGAGFFERLNGQWNLVLHDEGERVTLLISDRIGSRILFYAEDGQRFTFSSEAKGVIAGRRVSTRPGGVGLLQLLSSGMHCGDRTWFEGIRVLNPGTLLRLSADGRRRYRYHRMHFREGAPEMSEAAYAEGFFQRLKGATERCMRRREGHPVAITLSGGLDSRSIALAIDRRHLPITSITYGASESPDAIYARQLAELIGFDHHHIEDLWPELAEESARVADQILGPSPSGRRGFYSCQLDRALWRSEAMSALYGVASTIWHPLYRKHMRVMLNGTCGDAMTGSHLTPNLLLGPKREEVIADLRRRALWQPPDLVRMVVEPAFLSRHEADLEAYFRGTFEEIDADEALAVANIWDMENRQRRGSFSSFTIERYFCTCRSPYLDYELTEFLARVPGRWRFQQRIYKRMLVEHFPEARHVPWAYTQGRITASPTYEFVREAFNFSKGRLRRLLPKATGKMPHWLFRDEVSMLRDDKDLAFGIEAFVKSDVFPSDVLSRPGVLELVRRFQMSERASEMATMYSHLVGIAKCCELFLARDGDISLPEAADPARFGVDTSR